MKAFYWDQVNGYLYFKLASQHVLEGPDQKCPGDQCIDLVIKREDESDVPAVCDSPVPPYVHSEDPPEDLVQPACSGVSTSQGLGAAIESGFAPPSSGSSCV
ncbi:hypothetical protein ElyMa_007057100 [Elysia marginata]|uniref:CS domain-containing protein n=1 Tax=Elysia marginata TaxID=1093978 RepID=A0AAV4JX24_9GAST|nr:hypothetical protein ElyMa_007057100 [Elysia marginata]